MTLLETELAQLIEQDMGTEYDLNTLTLLNFFEPIVEKAREIYKND